MKIIAKQCDLKVKHAEHEWDEGAFRRWCKGRKRAVK